MAKGNIVRMVFVGTFLLIFGFYFANAIAPVITQVAGASGFAIPEGAVEISSIADGFVWTPLAFMALGKYTGWIGIGLFAVLVAVLFYFYKKNEAAWDKIAGAKGE
jgi:PTS system galactitol-specific IIC component